MAGPADSALWVLHVDLDQFLAAVEIRRDPALRGLPVVVGGDGDPSRARQVVSTCSYEARAFGIRSGMPLKQAHRRCPDAVFLPVDRPVYEAASEEVMAVLRTFTDRVQVYGWDEAYLALEADDPVATAQGVREEVLSRTGLPCSVGVGDSKLRAKTATGFAKPGGVAVLTAADWLPRLGEEPVTALNGVGPRTAARLGGLGIRTVAELAAADLGVLAAAFNPSTGPWIRSLGVGDTGDPVDPTPREPTSRGHQTTYEKDLVGLEQVQRELLVLARQVTEEVVAEGRAVNRVFVTVRTASFFTRTLGSVVRPVTTDSAVVEATALKVLARFELDRPVRLLGVRLEFAGGAWASRGALARTLPE